MKKAMRNELMSGISSAVSSTTLSTITPTVARTSCGACAPRKSKRSSMPIEMKNMLEKMSRKGTISANT